ncbi:MAG: phenylalanine--tRNA ligase subunit beta [Pseudomonadota bacterium]|jgi:phenylalanyl-tRNA synthetase beta chain
MKLPLSWLKDWVSLSLPPAELASRLTLVGFEVESVTPAAPPFSGVVVAEILEAAQHPQADKLRVCKVSTGSGDPLQIVCGAPNARAGIKVALAQVGAVLAGDLKIKAAKLRGVESFGMLCSSRELDLSSSHEGILELSAEAVLGRSLREQLELDDVIIEVSVYPNRGDAMSVQGIAREVSALLRLPLTGPALGAVAATNSVTHPVVVDAPSAAPRFLSRVLQGLDNTRATPDWMQERLRRAGLRPISPVVDVTNYVMLELGQPMHAYERQRLNGAMQVRLARAGESLELLDGRTVELQPDILVIADDERAIGLAGIMGGAGTSITEGATDVLLEVAFFSPDAIAGRGRRFGLQTDASQRFERGVDPAGQERAMERATALLLQICGGTAGPVVVAGDDSLCPARPSRTLRRRQLARLVGTSLPDADVEAALRALQMQVVAIEEGWQVTPPSWRFDLNIEADLIEEAVRVIGYDRVPEVPAPLPQRFRRRPESVIDERVVLDTLVGRGYQEAIHYAFVDPAMQQRLFPGSDPVKLANPIAADLAVMRTSLWPGLLKGVIENQRRQQDRVRLFELGAVFEKQPDRSVRESRRLAGIALGPRLSEQWGAKAEAADFFDLKSDVMAILGLSNKLQAFEFVAESHACLHPGRAACVKRGGEVVGWLGELHPQWVRELDLPAAPLLFELDLLAATCHEVPKAHGISRFPQVRRDLSLSLPEGTPLSALRDRATVAGGSLLRDLRVFDVYQGPGIESGRKSVAFGLIFQDNNRTLKDDEADQLVAGIADDLKKHLDAKARE